MPCFGEPVRPEQTEFPAEGFLLESELQLSALVSQQVALSLSSAQYNLLKVRVESFTACIWNMVPYPSLPDDHLRRHSKDDFQRSQWLCVFSPPEIITDGPAHIISLLRPMDDLRESVSDVGSEVLKRFPSPRNESGKTHEPVNHLRIMPMLDRHSRAREPVGVLGSFVP